MTLDRSNLFRTRPFVHLSLLAFSMACLWSCAKGVDPGIPQEEDLFWKFHIVKQIVDPRNESMKFERLHRELTGIEINNLVQYFQQSGMSNENYLVSQDNQLFVAISFIPDLEQMSLHSDLLYERLGIEDSLYEFREFDDGFVFGFQ